MHPEAPTQNWKLAIVGAAGCVFFVVLWFLTWTFFWAIPLMVSVLCLVVGLIPLPTSVQRRARFVGIVSIVIAFLLACGLLQYSIRTGYPVKIIVPIGYKGKFWIVIDKVKGQTPVPVDGVWTFEIPSAGILYINDDSAFTIGHSEDFYFSDGRRFAVIDDGYGSSKAGDPIGYHWAVRP